MGLGCGKRKKIKKVSKAFGYFVGDEEPNGETRIFRNWAVKPNDPLPTTFIPGVDTIPKLLE